MASKFEQTSETTTEFSFEFLKQITDNFSEERIIGRGGYGIVYKGKYNGKDIALKKLHPMPGLDDKQFRNEFNHLMRAQHPNITHLVGYCYHVGHQRIKLDDGEYVFAHVEERVLCLEYLHRGSLDNYISDESCGLDWQTCFKIIKGVCDGLNYLHNGSRDPIYHLDLKPANILLDKDMVPKIGDFGLSRLFPSAQTYVTDKIMGTRGYMPPEYIDRCEITSKYDVFSLGVIIVRIMAGDEGYSRCVHMSSQEFIERVHNNWEKRLKETMLPHISEQVRTCIEIALWCVEINRVKRPTIAEIVDELNKVDTAESSPKGEVASPLIKHYSLNQHTNAEHRGSIVFSATGRPPVPFDIFSCPFSPLSVEDELHLTDGVSHNYNGRSIPPAALKTLLKSPKLANEGGATDADIDSGRISGIVFVSERDHGLETLCIGLRFNVDGRVKVFTLADIFGSTGFGGTRMEDSGCFGGGYTVEPRIIGGVGHSAEPRIIDHTLIYVSTKEATPKGRNPWTVVYKFNLTTGKTDRVTPPGMFEVSPAVSPSGNKIAVALFRHNRWNGEIDNLQTNICVMNSDRSYEGWRRRLIIRDGGWPSWGSDNIIFFHRGTDRILASSKVETSWGVFRHDITTMETVRVTPEELDAVTPAAISETKVAVATIRQKSKYSDIRVEAQYRHIEIFDTNALGQPPVLITQKTSPESDHYNPFVLDGGQRIGYHRCRIDLLQHGDLVPCNLHKLESPVKDVSLFRVSGVIPAISKDGSKLAFVDNESKAVWVADSQGLRVVYEKSGPDKVFSAVWNQNPDKDILYICVGTSFSTHEPLEIYAISNASTSALRRCVKRLTYGGFNNAFPSSSPDGNKFVFRSARDKREKKHKNLYIMLDKDIGEYEEGWVMRLTKGRWTDTHCQWSPNGNWIVFSSTRDKPEDAEEELDNGLDPGYSVYLLDATDPTVVIRVMSSGSDLCGHINQPVFSPDGRSIAVAADLAGVSVDPTSLPRYYYSSHAMRHYSDIFVLDIDPDNEDKEVVKEYRRMTHSRYECGIPVWTMTNLLTTGLNERARWNMGVIKI